MQAVACPTHDALVQFAAGNVSDDELSSIGEHLDSCEQCRKMIDTVDLAGDTLVSALRRPLPVDEYEGEAAQKRAAEQIRSIGCEPSVGRGLSATRQLEPVLAHNRLGQYELLGELGRGGMGTVYKAVHSKLKRVVAIKVLASDRMKDEAAVGRFEREMQAVGALHHPNIVAAHDAGEADGIHYLAMEYVDGLDLAELVRARGPLPAGVACELIRQAALGLQEAHEHGMVHRDIKPSNLMLARTTGDGLPAVKVLDLGLALLDDAHPDDVSLTSTGQAMGTLSFMAPEQADDSHAVDIRADIYSLGGTLYKLLSGEAPFSGEKYNTPLRMLSALANETPPSIATMCAGIPAELVAVVDQMLARSPEQRFTTPSEVATALAPFADAAGRDDLNALLTSDGANSRVDQPTLPEAQPQQTRRGSNRKTTLVACLMIVLAALSLVFVIRGPQGDVTVTVKSDDIDVVIDDGAVRVTDRNWEGQLSVDEHRLSLKIRGTSVPFDHGSGMFVADGQQIVVKLGDVELRSDRFEVTRDRVTVLTVEVTPAIAETGKPISFDRHADRVAAVAVSPDGSLALSGSYDGTARLWEIATGRQIRVLKHERSGRTERVRVASLGFSSDGKRAWSASFEEDDVYIWNLDSGEIERKLKQPCRGSFSAAFVARDSQLVVAGRDSVIRTWDINSAKVVDSFETPSRGRSFSHGILVSQTLDESGAIEVWDHETGTRRLTLSAENFSTEGRYCFSPDGSTVLSGSRDSTVYVWDARAGELLHELKGHSTRDDISGVACSPDGRFAISATQGHVENGNWTSAGERLIRLWDLWTGLQVGEFAGHTSHIHSLTFTPDGKFVLSASSDKTVRVWKMPSEQRMSDFALRVPSPAVAPFEKAQAQTLQLTWADHLNLPVEHSNSIGMKLRVIPPGEFTMGSEGEGSDGNERPVHPVRLTRPFLMGVAEVTVGQFQQFVEETDYRTQAETDGKGGAAMTPGSTEISRSPDINWRNWWDGQTDDHPVVNVCWKDAVAFCEWLSTKEGLTYRLPTDAEFEFACRAGTTSRHPYGDQIEDLSKLANLMDQSYVEQFGKNARAAAWNDSFPLTAPVGSFPENNFGLHDMLGNVNEHCFDRFGPYGSQLETDPTGPASGNQKVLRGGHFLQAPERYSSSNRGFVGNLDKHCGWGFRVVCEIAGDLP